MGSCLSTQTFHSTAMLIMEDGGLQEFFQPVKVAEILSERAGFFVCHADSMSFDEYLSPLNAEHKLQLDELYFVLPLQKLKYPLPAAEMAALAVRAAAALERRRHKNSNNCSRCDVVPWGEGGDGIDRRQIHRLPSTAELGEFNFRKESGTLKSRNLRQDWISVEKSKRMASRQTMAAQNVWKTRLSTIPEQFAK